MKRLLLKRENKDILIEDDRKMINLDKLFILKINLNKQIFLKFHLIKHLQI